jgi:outer membrane lipoprotein-sorting protein
MTPTSKALREYFQTIVLVVDKANYSANSIEMNEPSGDKTTIWFTDKKLNTQVSDEMFTL